MASSWQPGRALKSILWTAAGLAALVALVSAPVAAQILKCTDGSGNVTYQNEPCPKNVKAGRVDIFDNSWTADRAEKEAEWRRNAAQHRVVTGMPLRWVRDALGEPAEIRDTATAGAAAVWLYNFPDRNVQVGILADQVLWFRETPMIRPPASVSPAPERPAPDRAAAEALRATPEAPLPAPDISRSALASPSPAGPARAVTRGQDCRQALAELGKPDRQREVPPLDSASDPVTEYIYEPAGSANPTRTRVVCANGRVEGVDRTVVR
ncbi:MAG TPA: DUF4124 domain-containing protein [Casimicrobiaceae bacterium]